MEPLQRESTAVARNLDAVLESLDLCLNRPELAIICKRCKYALQPSGDRVTRHLWEKHQISASARQGLTSLVASLALEDPNKLPLRHDDSIAHPHLTKRRGLACKGCKERTTSRELMQRHLAKAHGCKGNRKSLPSDSMQNYVTLQSWTQNGPRESWIVKDDEYLPLSDGDDHDAPQASPRRQNKVAALHEEELRRIAQNEQDDPIAKVASDDLTLTTNWMRRTGWAKTFANADRRLLSMLDNAPAGNGQSLELGCYGSRILFSSAEDERRLVMVGEAADRFFERCEDTAQHTDHSIRCWLRSQVPGRSYKAPFELPGRIRTRVTYRNLWKRMLFVLLRLFRLDDAMREEFLGMRLSMQQQEAIELLWAVILDTEHEQDIVIPGPAHTALPPDQSARTSFDVPVSCLGQFRRFTVKSFPTTSQRHSLHEDIELESEAELSDDLHSDSDYDNFGGVEVHEDNSSDETIDAAPREARDTIVQSVESPSDDKLADAVAKLSAFLCMEEFSDSRASSTFIVYFSGLIGFPYPGSTFERPQRYTPKLSALIYCIRLCLLETTIPRYAHPSIGWKARPHSGLLKRLNPVREQFMCLGCQAPMGELLSLRSYGRAISRSDGPTFRVQWSDDSQTVCWDAGKEVGSLAMDQLRQFGRKSSSGASASLTRLMYGWVPDIELKNIRDTISNQKKGYSFVQEHANQLNTAYLDLSSRACLDPVNGLMRGDQWNMAAVRHYLQEEVNFLTKMMLVMHLLGGQAPRSPDLFSIEHRNGESTSRGICVHEGVVVYIIRHWKARQATNKEFNVARYLTPDASRMLAIYLIYVRPFTDMLCRVCLRHQRERRLLFASPEHPEKPWKVGALTNALKELTKAVCGTSFGVQVYRQLSIAVTEKHIKQISKPFNRYDDKSVSADIEVAFSWQSGHRPLQRGTTYGIDGAFPDSLQPALLRIYKWASGEWQGFMVSGNTTSSSSEFSQESLCMEKVGDKRHMPTIEEEREAKRRQSAGSVRLASTRSRTPAPEMSTSDGEQELCMPVMQTSKVNLAQGTVTSEENSGCDNTDRTWVNMLQRRRARHRRKHMSCTSQLSEDHLIAEDLFSFLVRYGVIVCKECKHAIWPSEVDSHLANVIHRLVKTTRQRIQREVQQWEGLVTSAERLDLPITIQKAIPELLLHDGFLCKLDEQKCTAVFRSHECLRKHWRGDHNGWTVSGKQGRGGRLGWREQQAVEERFNRAHEKVRCQRFFASRHGSQFIRVC